MLLSSDSQGFGHLYTGGQSTWISPPVTADGAPSQLSVNTTAHKQVSQVPQDSFCLSTDKMKFALDHPCNSWLGEVYISVSSLFKKSTNKTNLKLTWIKIFFPSEIYEGTLHRTRGEIDPHAEKQEIQKSHLMHTDWTYRTVQAWRRILPTASFLQKYILY